MTIKRKLFVSNILMIFVPLFVAALVALAAGFAFWRVVYVQYMDESLEDKKLPLVLQMISRQTKSFIENGNVQDKSFDSMKNYAEKHGIFISAKNAAGEILFSAGTESEEFIQIEEKFSAFLSETENESFSANVGGISFLQKMMEIRGEKYSLTVAGTFSQNENEANEVVFKLIFFAVAALAIAAVFVTNGLLTHFILKKVQSPLEILKNGVKNISKGNLFYRINYSGDDEFLPICNAFNSMAERLLELSEAQKKDEKNRRELIAGISHDLRTPLTSIKAYVEGLNDGVADTKEKRKKYMATILSKTDEIITMTERLFMFSKLDLDEFPFSAEKINVAAEIKKIAQSSLDDYGGKLSIETCFSKEAEDAKIIFDKIQFTNAMANIIENSVKYCGKEKCVVKISCSCATGSVEISVLDNGPGVPKDSLEKLFDVFYRTDSARSPKKKGSGLGLAITAKVCRHFGGTIFAENATEKDALTGLKITMRIPLVN